jgi:polycomb protein EED
LESFACVAIFAGQNGHTKGILSVSWHPHREKFATSGYDHFIRLWNIRNPSVSEALQASFGMNRSECRNAFRPIIHQFPYFATRKVHNNWVDCVQWLGHMILSKSTYNQIILWEPDLSSKKKVDAASYQPPDDVIVLRTFEIFNCNIWFVRFGIDLMGQHLAVGNLSGEVDVWKIDDCQKEPSQKLKTSNEVTIRMMAFSPDGKTLVSCADDATISRWDLV